MAKLNLCEPSSEVDIAIFAAASNMTQMEERGTDGKSS